MKIEKLHKYIYHIKFKTQEELCKTMLRFSEFRECPNFAGKIFTLGQYRAWYAEKNGSFSYYSDWSGFNIPCYVLDKFRSGLFDPLSLEEQILLEAIPAQMHKFYVIATYEQDKDDKNTIEHEVYHAMYYISKEYRVAVDTLLVSKHSQLKQVYDKIRDLGYSEGVFADEAQAYIGASFDWLNGENVKYPCIVGNLIELKIKYFDKTNGFFE